MISINHRNVNIHKIIPKKLGKNYNLKFQYFHGKVTSDLHNQYQYNLIVWKVSSNFNWPLS